MKKDKFPGSPLALLSTSRLMMMSLTSTIRIIWLMLMTIIRAVCCFSGCA